ncbi:hypothetical protein [Schumannella soli]|uniref:Uncharacterized protein n=1 Tax=Schumannella soli TaxID=2590779 RepID=A0A506Y5X3_9MICO|nr:hypothetical protein [Schumannella soli]TPW78056.1 hypothetical protein FJ657_05365 [Schumannella soli]
MPESAAVWFANERPVRIVWHGRRYRVNDTPTRLEPGDVWHPAMTHPIERRWSGWRFQAVDADGNAPVFDLRPGAAAGEWIVLAVHDAPPAARPAAR